ncbi:acetoacetyl-CoA synthetase [Sinobacterium caligoides]|uniref:Acetoacetyl-CoA synthetase n=1 Tax=Sinobacterium caligoides TaxID=933926 RepID=A0A3N2DDR7_9GAMM|nr:acetoacetate--CoA ligase [Sinobacterium caligoides]ROR97923.1 acetoacetyl-CoA synthetase [Sinobacterium caligoides]
MRETAEPLWGPSAARVQASAMRRFQFRLREQLEGDDYAALHRWSVEQREAFWSALWDFAAIVGDKGAPPLLCQGDRLPGSSWFPRASLNYAENLLRRRDDHPALVARLEDGQRQTLSYAQLYRRVAGLGAAMRAEGVVAGDRVAAFVPNVADAVVAMLATASIGAVWSSCSPDFGVQGLLDRFGQIEPKLLFTADGYYYNGRRHDSLARVREILPSLPSVERVVVLPVLGVGDVAEIASARLIDDYIVHEVEVCEFNRLPFDHPLFILYSSGTTGRPKCIVHGAGGTLLEHQKEHLLHTDIGPDDVFFYFSTCGWMMWNWQLSGLATGCTLLLYDGSPTYPQLDSLLGLVDAEGITVFGCSARYIATLQRAEVDCRGRLPLTTLQTVLSTGSPLAAESFRYVYRAWKPDLLLSSISGGTDILGAFASGNPCLPVFAGELQCIGLGFDLAVYGDDGQSLTAAKGELVCRRSFPSVPLGFWRDSGDRRFVAAYFSRFANTWWHGDYAELTDSGGLVIHGRSDALLNPGGVRIGTAEIYRQVDQLAAVADAIVIGQRWQGDCRIVLFVRLAEGVSLSAALERQIAEQIRRHTTQRHVPAKIIQVADIPRTMSGKLAEVAVRKVVHGEPLDNLEALANPESLQYYRQLAALSDSPRGLP